MEVADLRLRQDAKFELSMAESRLLRVKEAERIACYTVGKG